MLPYLNICYVMLPYVIIYLLVTRKVPYVIIIKMNEKTCYHHYLERYTNMVFNFDSKDDIKKVEKYSIKNDQLSRKQSSSQHSQLLNFPHCFHYRNHLPSDE